MTHSPSNLPDLDAALAHAFPADSETAPESADADPSLLAVAPPQPAPADLEPLVEAQRSVRILRIKSAAAVSLAALLSVLGSILFHAFILGGGIFLFYFAVKSTLIEKPPILESGGAGDGLIAQGNAPTLGDPAIVGPLNETRGAAPTPPPTPLPSLPAANLQNLNLPQFDPDPAPADFGSPKPRPLPTRVPQLDFTAPPTASTNPAPAINTGNTGVGGNAVASAGLGQPGDGSEPDEPPLPSLMSGSGGVGNGKGRHAGDGIDRGESGANNPSPQILNADPSDPGFRLPHNPKVVRDVKARVIVLSNAQKGDITILQSCGDPDTDEAYRVYCRTFLRFRPAYRAGKAIAAPFDVGTMEFERKTP